MAIEDSFRFHGAVDLVVAGVHLSLAGLTLLHGRRTALGPPLLALCLAMAGWATGGGLSELTGGRAWHALDLALLPLILPLALWLVVAFVGRIRRSRLAVLGFGVVFPVACWLELVRRDTRVRPFIVGSALVLAVAVRLLTRHLRDTTDRVERSRARILLAAFAIGCLFGPLDFLEGRHHALRLGNLAVLLSSLLLAVGTVRFALLGTVVTPGALLIAVLLATGVAGSVAVALGAGGVQPAAVALSAALAGALVLFLMRRALEELARERERRAQLMTLGLFASQMSHDLRNPLAALKATVQFMQGELARAQSLPHYAAELERMGWQVGRIERLVTEYDRLGRVEVQPVRRALNDVVARATATSGAGGSCRPVSQDLATDLPLLELDEDLVAAAVENAVRNAGEALRDGGQVRVSTRLRRERGASAEVEVELVVEDDGIGMDARALERAFEPFFTTKSGGTGLGLPFIRRVMEAHGGTARLSSQPQTGTRLELVFPVPSSRS
jgi:signal transduction histidine kinase